MRYLLFVVKENLGGSVMANNGEDHDPLEMVLVRDTMRFLWGAHLPPKGTGHWDDGKPRTAAESTWRSIVGQP
jgi:hypothetical protein